jgi:hypothetical protein
VNRWLLVLALAGCHHGGAPVGKTANCEQVATHVQQLLDPKPEAKLDAKPETKPDPKLDPKPESKAEAKPESDRAKRVHDIFAARCTQDKWPQPALTCMFDTAALHDGHHCKDQLSVDQRRLLDADLDALEHDAGVRAPAECTRYKTMVGHMEACPKLSQASRSAALQAYDTIVAPLRTATDDQRRVIEQSCKANADAIEQTIMMSCNIK